MSGAASKIWAIAAYCSVLQRSGAQKRLTMAQSGVASSCAVLAGEARGSKKRISRAARPSGQFKALTASKPRRLPA